MYDRVRPPYPGDAIDWLLPPGAARVADVGAGTGKLTRQLRERGLAVAEAARVLTPGGRLCLLWNLRDERDDVVARLSEIMQSWESQDAGGHLPAVGPPFAPAERFDTEWVYRLPRDAVVDYVASRSYVITKPDGEREAMLCAVRELLATHPATAGGGEVSLPQVTRCTRAELPH